MSFKERMKYAKINEEISAYLIDRGYTDLSININIKEEETLFTVTVEKQQEDLIEVFKKDLYCCREVELEAYGWDNLHAEDCVCTMNTLGMLVDNYEIRLDENRYIITLHRLK